MSDAMPSTPSSPGQKPEHVPDSILAILKHACCSTRLMNAIAAGQDKMPVNTIQDYMINPEQSREGFLRLPNLGTTSANELDKIMRSVTPCDTSVKPTTEVPNNMDNAIRSSPPDISDPQEELQEESREESRYTPDSILTVLQNTGCSVRLMNVITSNWDQLPVKTA